jgi:hypothetical protein
MEKPTSIETIQGNIPEKLKRLVQWLLWKYWYDKKEGKWKKIPINARNGKWADYTDPDEWAPFEIASQKLQSSNGQYAGVGVALSPKDEYAGGDLDDCRDPVTCVIEPWADDIAIAINSYTEISPSATGLRIILEGCFEGKKRQKIETESGPREIEMYCEKRWLTMTGQVLSQYADTIENRQAELDAVRAKYYLTAKPTAPTPPAAPEVDDLLKQNISDRLEQLKVRKPKFADLWKGGWQELGYVSYSEGDLALCNYLRHEYGPDPALIDRLFRKSKMYRDKWDSKRGDSTYGWDTINKAIESAEDVFDKAQKTILDKISEKLGIPIKGFEIRKYVASDTMYAIRVLADDGSIEEVGLTAQDVDSQTLFRRNLMGASNKRIKRFTSGEWDQIIEDLLRAGKTRMMSIDESDIGIVWNIIHESIKTGDQFLRYDDPQDFINSQAVLYTPLDSEDEFIYLEMAWLRKRLSNEGFKSIAVNPRGIGKFLRVIGFGEPSNFRINTERGPNRWRVPLEDFLNWRDAQTQNGCADPI